MSKNQTPNKGTAVQSKQQTKAPRGKETRNNNANNSNRKSENALSNYVGSGNDPEWYNKNHRLVTDASKLSFANQLGTPLDYNVGYDQLGVSVSSETVPGIMALQMINVPGIALTANDGVNIAAQGVFQHIRKDLSTVASYAAADVMASILAIDEVYSMYANIARAFGIINGYSAINMYLPIRLLEAGYGFSPAAIGYFQSNLNDYRSRFNTLIYRASTLFLPVDFSVTKRHAWLYSNYYADANSIKSQCYIHRMMYHHIFDETTYPTGSALSTVANSTDGIAQLLDQFEAMINALRDSDSFLKIQADMRRAFKDHQVWKLAYQDEGYMIAPTHSDYVLSQINNMSIVPPIGGTNCPLTEWDITQNVNKNNVSINPTWTYTAAEMNVFTKATIQLLTNSKVLNMHKDDVTTDDITEMTRNTVQMKYISSEGTYIANIMQCGVDVCVGAVMYNMEGQRQLRQAVCQLTFDTEGETLSKLAAFDYHPLTYVQTAYDGGTGEQTLAPLVDLCNYTLIDPVALNRLHQNILCSMWEVPEIGVFAL